MLLDATPSMQARDAFAERLEAYRRQSLIPQDTLNLLTSLNPGREVSVPPGRSAMAAAPATVRRGSVGPTTAAILAAIS